MPDELPADGAIEGAVADVASAEVTVANPQGLHLRPATEFARLVQESGCNVRVRYGDAEGDGASVLELAMLAIRPGARLCIEAHGPRCEQALANLVALVGSDGRS